MNGQPIDRRHYIDWVRILAFFLLIFFHCAMPFVSFNWEIKDHQNSAGLSRLIWWLHQWRLPLLFFVAGAGIYFSLKKRSVISFMGERFVRLFVPLLFAMFFTIPFQVYFEKLQRGKITGSYAAFYPSVWKLIPYPEGSLSWSHLWFVVYLFVFTILLMPIWAVFKIPAVARLKEKFANFLSNPLFLVLLVAPFVGYYLSLFLKYPEQGSLVDDWFVFTFSITLVFYGYLLSGSDRFWHCCEKYRYSFLLIAVCCIVILYDKFWWNGFLQKIKKDDIYLYGLLNSLQVWLLILSVMGFAKRHLNFSNRFLLYINQAVYPFYILHQTLIVVFGYYIVQWSLPMYLKMLILVLLCFASLLIIYHFLVRPFKLTRILYGLKPKQIK